MNIFLLISLYDKKGPLGPNRYKGEIKGRQVIQKLLGSCKIKTVQIMTEEAIQKIKNENDITPKEKINLAIFNSEERKVLDQRKITKLIETVY